MLLTCEAFLPLNCLLHTARHAAPVNAPDANPSNIVSTLSII